MKVDLFYLSPNPYGGWVTYTVHLIKALQSVGLEPTLYKIGSRTEKKSRDFGYATQYRNISLHDALALPNKKLIVAAAKNFKEQTQLLYDANAALVVHDPTELKNLPHLTNGRVVVVRQIGASYIPRATFIRHPYESKQLPAVDKYKRAVSVSRIDFDKHTNILLDANRLIKDECHKIEIYGFENRIYTRFKILPHYPEWKQSKVAYPRNINAAYAILQGAQYMVDMSLIKGDGGGTQYTTLEAWDAGAVPIIHKGWLLDSDDMNAGSNCLVVANAQELAGTLAASYEPTNLDYYRRKGKEQLLLHEPKLIGEQYKTFLDGL